MANERHSSYRGCSITTRWSESELPDEESAKRFSASFSVDSPEPHSAWQQFLEDLFATSGRASDSALQAAKRSIDQSISDRQATRRSRN